MLSISLLAPTPPNALRLKLLLPDNQRQKGMVSLVGDHQIAIVSGDKPIVSDGSQPRGAQGQRNKVTVAGW
jgi:hypothetical protein